MSTEFDSSWENERLKERIAALEAKVRELEAELVKEKERADYAWRNTNAIDQSRMKTEERVKQLEAEREQLIDTSIDKIMAASDKQINALCRLEGHDPDDEAKLAKYACETAILKHKLTASQQQVERLAQALERCLDTYSRTSKRIPPTTQEAEKMLDDIREANQGAREALSAIKQYTKGRKS